VGKGEWGEQNTSVRDDRGKGIQQENGVLNEERVSGDPLGGEKSQRKKGKQTEKN